MIRIHYLNLTDSGSERTLVWMPPPTPFPDPRSAAAAALPRNVSSRIALLIGIEASDRPTRTKRGKRERNAAAAAAERMSAILIKGAAVAEEGGDRGRKEGPFYFRANYADANGLQGARSGEGEAAGILVRFPAERLRVRTLPLPLVIARTNCATEKCDEQDQQQQQRCRMTPVISAIATARCSSRL